MTDLDFPNVTVHVLAALLWQGGMSFLAAVGAPAVRAVEPGALRAEPLRLLRERLRTVDRRAIVVLVVTGLLNPRFRGRLERVDALVGPVLVIAAVHLARGG